MHMVLNLMLLIILIFSCQISNQSTLNEIQQLEFQRLADESKFINWLNSKDFMVREKAVESLGRIQDTSTISWVANRLTDQNDSVRSKAAFSMGQFFSIKAEEPLSSMLPHEKDPGIRSKMVEALGKVGSDKHFILIRNAIESNDRQLEKAGTIGFAILAYRGYPLHNIAGSLSSLLLNTSDPLVRWRSAYGLYRSASFSEFNPLVKSLQDSDPLTRYFSLKAQATIIGYLKSSQAEKYRSNEVLQSISTSIRSLDYSNSLKHTFQDSCWYVRLAALQVCENFAPAQLYADVQSGCLDENEQVRAVAIQAVASYHNRDAVSFLTNLFEESSSWREKGLVMLQLAQLRPQTSLKKIKNSLETSIWPENYYCIKALEHLENQETTSILQDLTQTEEKAQLTLVLELLVNRQGVPVSLFLEKLGLFDPAITTIVASKLAIIKDTSFVTPLLEAYDHFQAPSDVEPMLAILAALDSIPDLKAKTLLKREAQSPYLPIRRAAAAALSKLIPKSTVNSVPTSQPLTRYDFPLVQNNLSPKIRFYTSKGNFEIILYPQKAPVTVSNFIELVKSGFYDGIYFHRVVPGFVVQAGDPRGDGWGGPGYCIPCEYNDLFYDRGVVGMAHAGKDTGGSQFFITHTPQPHLNGRHTAFGKVSTGMEVVDRLEIYDQIYQAECIN